MRGNGTGRWNTHHALFTESTWDAQRETEALRNLPGLIMPMDVTVHRELHDGVPYVPVIPNTLAGRLLRVLNRSLQSKVDFPGNLERLADEIESRLDAYTVDWVTSATGPITVEAIRKQIPYVREGVIDPDIHLPGKRYRC